MRKFINLLKVHKWLIAILILGFFLRFYKFEELFYYSHDQDLAGWIIKDIIVDGHLRLIGQETSTHGIFIGPLFYYLLIPFYLMFGMDPIGGVFLVFLLGLFTIFSFYFVFTKVFDKKTGLIASLLYSVSFYTVMNDREVVPTMPVILWTVWYLYVLKLLLGGKQKQGLLLLGLLLGIIWHLNIALILLVPLAVLSIYLSRKKLDLRAAVNAVALFVTITLPLVMFEIRHGFLQTTSFLKSLTTDQRDIITGFDKVKRVIYLAAKDLNGLLWGSSVNINYELVLLALILVGILLFYKTRHKKMFAVLFGWFLLYISFFSLYSKIVSEYYLNGLITFYIAILALMFSQLTSIKYGKLITVLALALFMFWNTQRLFGQPINKSGYLERKSVINEISTDSSERGYPCVSISYITNPGYNLGYRYLVWIEKLKTKPISEKVPVYTIVFPQKPVFKTDKDFGAIGLIFPEYERYDLDTVNEECRGDDFNLEDSMWGYN